MKTLKSWQRPGWLVLVISGLLILLGLAWPSNSLVRFFQPDNGTPAGDLLTGAAFFRAGLLLMGVILLLLSGLPIWESGKTEKAAADGRSPRTRWLLAALLSLSFVIRLYQLNTGLWIDEILTYMNFARLPMGDLVTTYTSENQHFLFSILARISFVIFGESAWALRLPAVLFGVASIWALFEFGRYVAGEREGLLAAALLAFSYHHVWFSQNARGYTGLLFWTILASWLFLRALDTSRPWLWLGYAVSASLGMYTHLTMMFVIFSHLVIYLIALVRRRRDRWPERWHGFFLGFALTSFFVLFLYSLVLPQLLSTISATTSVVAEWRNPLWTLTELINGIMVSFAGGLLILGWIMVLLALSTFAVGLVSTWRTNENVIYLLILPSAVGGGLTVAMGHHLWPRFFLFAFGFAALVIVRGVMVTGTWLAQRLRLSPSRVAWAGTVACLAMILVSAASVAFAFGPKQDYEGAMAYVEANKEPDDKIVAVSIAGNIYKKFYGVDWQVVESVDELETIRAETGRTWIVYTFKPVLRSVYPDIMQAIEDEFETVKRFPGTVRQGALFVSVADEASS